MSSRTLMVLTSVAGLRQSRRLARAMVEQQLAACVQISPIESFYSWNGQLQQEREFRLVMKTTAARATQLQSALRAMHPYEVPAIYVLPLTRVHAAYARWVEQSCAAIRPRARRAAQTRKK